MTREEFQPHRGQALPATSAPAAAGTAAMPYPKVILAGICALIATVGMARFAYTPLLPAMRSQAGLSVLDGGLLATWNYCGYLCGTLIASWVHELHVKARLYRAALVLACLTTLGMGLTRDVTLWGVLRFLSGMSSTAGLLLASGLILNWLIETRRPPVLGLHFAGMGIGIVVTGLGVRLTQDWLGWDAQWKLFGVLSLFLIVPAWRWMPEPRRPAGAARAAPAGRTSLWLWLLNGAYCCAGVGYVVLATFIVDIAAQLPVFGGSATLVWVAVGLAAIPSAFVWDRIAMRLGSIVALMLAFGLQILSIGLLMTGSAAASLIAALCYGGTFVGIVNLTLSLAGRLAPGNPARAMARMTIGYSLAQIVTPALAGYMAEGSTSYGAILPPAAAAMAVGVALLAAILLLRRG